MNDMIKNLEKMIWYIGNLQKTAIKCQQVDKNILKCKDK